MQPLLPQLIVGLGNPGPKYAATRHNIGFLTIDRLLATARGEVREEHRFSSMLYRLRLAGRHMVLAKPLTFMNVSGEAVAGMRKSLELTPQEIMVVYDCLDLPLGRLRIRSEGGSGGHRGMQSVIDALETEQIPRLRIGIGRQTDSDVVDYVLSTWTAAEQPLVEQVVITAARAVQYAARRGVTAAMNAYNAWTTEQETKNGGEQPPVSMPTDD
jgi:PTH1 family peptidyl-tRNA hydrolase